MNSTGHETGRMGFDRLFMRARRLLDQGDIAGSISAYRRAAALQPRQPAVRAELGHALARGGDLAGALLEYDAARQLDPRALDYARALEGPTSERHCARSARPDRAAPTPPALVAMARAVRSTDVGPQDRPWVIAALQAALAEDPGNDRLHVKLANLLLTQGDHAGAATHLREANRLSRSRTHEQI